MHEDLDTYEQSIILLILILLSGIFSASETALTAFKRIKLSEVEKENIKAAELLKRWLKKPNEILTAILLGNNIVNILASSIATVLAIQIIGEDSEGNAVAFATLIMTFVILVFGEITPKIVAKSYSDTVSRIVILPIYYLSIILYPLILVLMFISKTISKIFGIRISNENLMITEDDIKSFVNVGEAEGIIEEEEKEMIHSIFEFGDTAVKEVFVPRTSMFALEGDQTIDEVWDEIVGKGFSRIPVYEERIDNIIGILYIKDLLNVVKEGQTEKEIKNFVRDAYFVPETKPLFELLDEFRKKQVHIAIALDEYGGTVGMLTIEDLLEEIVGEIKDEYDEEEDDIRKLGENKYKVDAMIDVETLNKKLDTDIPESENYETLGGFIQTTLGRVAEKDDILENNRIKIRILKTEKHRIDQVLIEILNKEEE